MDSTVYISIGSNIDPFVHIETAIALLARCGAIDAISSSYRTAPMDCDDQDDFINLALSLQTTMPPLELYHELKAIERETGRLDRAKTEPREIDLDILLYDDRVETIDRLTLPHGSIPHYGYVLIPLDELAPDLVHPALDTTIAALARALPSSQTEAIERLDHRFVPKKP